jgi:peptidoglycan/xylan/chitin deacetylase (PgdA/CDA1 family)
MASPARPALDALLRWTPAQAVMHRRRRPLLAVLTYHEIPDGDLFEHHLDVLEEMGTFVPLEAVAANVTNGAPLPDRPILLTFDDGDPSVLDAAAPRLHARGIPGVVFLVTDLIGTDDVLWTTEIDQLVGSGGRTSFDSTSDGRALARDLKQRPDHVRRRVIEQLRASATCERPKSPQLDARGVTTLSELGIAVASHTMSHPCLPQCTDDVIEREVAGSRQALTDLLGHPPLAFAYPNGLVDERSRHAVASAGYALAFAFDHRLSRVPPQDPYAISRLRVNGRAAENRVRTVVSGLHPAIHHMLGRA